MTSGDPTVVGAEPAEPVDQAAEAERRQRHAGPVDRAGLGLADVLELAHADARSRRAAMGSTTAKIRRHEPSCSSTPETAGPSAGRDRDRQGDVAHHPAPVVLGHHRHQRRHQQRHHHRGAARLHDPGDAAAPRTTGASVASSVPAANTPIAVAYAVRVVTRCRNQPVIGMTAAIVSMNAVESHWALRAEMSQVGHQPRDRVDHDRLVEDHDERGQHQHRITAGVRAGASRADTVVPSRSERLMQGQTRSAEGIHR